jgi:hypothetical protein
MAEWIAAKEQLGELQPQMRLQARHPFGSENACGVLVNGKNASQKLSADSQQMKSH